MSSCVGDSWSQSDQESQTQEHQQIQRATRVIETEDKSISTAYLPYTQNTYGRISRMLVKYNIKSVALPLRKISSYIPTTKDPLGLRTPGIYKITCECGKVYIGRCGRSVLLRIKEHGRHIRLAQPDKSAVAEHSFNLDHIIKLQDTNLLSTKTRYRDRLIREDRNKMHPNNMNRDGGFNLSKSWNPFLQKLKDRRQSCNKIK